MDMSRLYQNRFNIQNFGLTRHALFSVSPGMCPHFIVGNTVSIFNNISEQTVRIINKVTIN